jgi:predicted acylesterase/phospholipase RssA
MFEGAEAKLAKSGPRKLLSLDGGGIRGLITIEILSKIERILREQSGRPSLVLADYFDYIAGTSTGAVIGTLLSLGRSVDEIRGIYLDCGRMMFDKDTILGRLPMAAQLMGHYMKRWVWEPDAYAKYPDAPLAGKLKELVGADTTLGTDKLRTLLLVVLSNASTDSPWPISNNPRAKYNDPALPDSNANFPLWQLVRASTAAPTYFPPQEIRLPGQSLPFVFVDGGVTSYNNPSFQLFLQATLAPYRVSWPAGEKEMLLVSIGTGLRPNVQNALRREDLDAALTIETATEALFNAAMYQQDQLCRVFGRCWCGEPLDEEIGDLIGTKSPADPSRLFTYVRYNATLTEPGLGGLGVGHIDPKDVQALDSIEHMKELQEIGRAVAETRITPLHFAGFPA